MSPCEALIVPIWFACTLAIGRAVIGTAALQALPQFTRPWPIAPMAVGCLGAFHALRIALVAMPVGVA